jgi:ATPase subunit of ABC transporter with duplicated ATPase domains
VLNASGVTVEIGGRTLVREASFVIADGVKVGLVGRNGSGKSSLLAVLVGETPHHIRSTGDVAAVGTVGHLPQVPVPGGRGLEPNGLSHVLSARGLDVLDDELHRARAEMAADASTGRIERFTELEERYRLAGGYEMEGRIARLADGVGLPQDLLLEDLGALSGGQRRRVDLIRVLFGEPDLMILDEPTNHLDLAAKRWLMDELSRFGGSLLVVSHDLKLLDSAIDKVLYLANHELREFSGTYSSFRAQLAADQERREGAAGREKKEIQRLSTLADSMRGQTVSRARAAKVLDRRVERLRANRTTVHRRERTVRFTLPVPARSGATPLAVHALAVSYGDKHVLRRIEFSMGRGERVVVVGRNGVGKSSLLRCLAGVQEPSAGHVETGHNVAVGYFAQEHEQLDPSRPVLDHIDDTVVRTEAERRALLGGFGLSGTVAQQLPPSLSGGERAKLSLAMLSAGRANLLVLDEPTNNLDPASVEAVGAMLAAWPGTIVAVSHDRPFVEALAPTHTLHLPAERFELWRDDDLDEVELR